MTENLVIDVIKDGITSVILAAAPVLLISMAVGLIISIFQASTQIQEQTLTFVPKIIAVFASIIIFGPWMLHIFVGFAERMFNMIPNLIR
ncbi:MAG TPA: flagellar biosynthetic protein FliQ [Clostridiaceae bacterium]|jgi:flagellar biosynthetic protein FliQ|nr:flagellar biosynthetic protein FliQ [Clostridiaceae bacterium]